MTIKNYILTLLVISSNAFAETKSKDIKEIEDLFNSETKFQLIHKHQDLPKDIQGKLWLLIRSKRMANYGEAFNRTDVVDSKYPMAQHQYTLLSDNISASLVKRGGLGPVQQLLLVNRKNTEKACTFHVKWDLEFKESLQYIIKNKREMSEYYFQSYPRCRSLNK